MKDVNCEEKFNCHNFFGMIKHYWKIFCWSRSIIYLLRLSIFNQMFAILGILQLLFWNWYLYWENSYLFSLWITTEKNNILIWKFFIWLSIIEYFQWSACLKSFQLLKRILHIRYCILHLFRQHCCFFKWKISNWLSSENNCFNSYKKRKKVPRLLKNIFCTYCNKLGAYCSNFFVVDAF